MTQLSRVAQDYLARIAPSRALYRALYQEALGLLRPDSSPLHGLERMESFASIAKLARGLSVGTSTARGDLQRLVNFGWVILEKAPTPRLLGHREGVAIYLTADAVALAATSEDRLVSRIVLAGLEPPVAISASPSAPAADPGLPGRGVGRRWRGPTS